VGCIPSKALLAAADSYRRAGEARFPGVATSQAGLDMAALVGEKDQVVAGLRQEKYLDLAAEYGFEIIRGRARFFGPGLLSVDGRQVTASRFLLATGASPAVPPVPGLAEAGYLTSTTAMDLDRVPASLVVVGGNYVGLEMAQLFCDLGSRVTLVEALDRLAPNEEPEVSSWITQALAAQGVEVVTGAAVARVEPGEPKVVVAEAGGRRLRLAATDVLVATGRRPVLDGLGLEAAGVERDGRGRLVLDEGLATTNPAVYAAGDVTGGPQFVYVAAAQGTLAADNALGGLSRRMDYTALPRVTFTTPSIAGVGPTEAQALADGADCECRVLGLDHVPRARVGRDTLGGVKVVAERGSGRVLGVSAVAEGAGELALAAVYAVRFGLSVSDLADTWAPYLTMAESLKLAAQSFTTDVARLSCCAV
jgi:mercuric reductase